MHFSKPPRGQVKDMVEFFEKLFKALPPSEAQNEVFLNSDVAKKQHEKVPDRTEIEETRNMKLVSSILAAALENPNATFKELIENREKLKATPSASDPLDKSNQHKM